MTGHFSWCTLPVTVDDGDDGSVYLKLSNVANATIVHGDWSNNRLNAQRIGSQPPLFS
jgi:hypothetical protein